MNDVWADVRESCQNHGRLLRVLRYGHNPPLLLAELAARVGTDAPMLSRIEWGTACPDEELGERLTAWMSAQGRLQTSQSVVTGPSAMTTHIVTPTPARATHPDTSRKAMDSINRENAWAIHNWIIELLDWSFDGLTHEQIWTTYQAWRDGGASTLPKSSQSGLRTRVSELVRGGVVQDSGRTRTMTTGRQAIVWELTQENHEQTD